MNLPPGPTAEAAILAYAAPLIARMTLNRDGLRAGLAPMAYRTALLSRLAKGHHDPLALNDGADPSEFGEGLADVITQAIGHARRWAATQLVEARSMTEDAAGDLLEAHVTWNVLALMSEAEIEVLSSLGTDSDGDPRPEDQ